MYSRKSPKSQSEYDERPLRLRVQYRLVVVLVDPKTSPAVSDRLWPGQLGPTGGLARLLQSQTLRLSYRPTPLASHYNGQMFSISDHHTHVKSLIIAVLLSRRSTKL